MGPSPEKKESNEKKVKKQAKKKLSTRAEVSGQKRAQEARVGPK